MKKTRKDKKLRKTRGRGRRRTQRGGDLKKIAEDACNEIKDAKDIKSATTLYKKAAIAVHPDKHLDNKEAAEKAFKVLGNCFDTKKKSLESGQSPQPTPSPAPTQSTTYDRTPKGDLYVYFYRNGERVDFNTLTDQEQLRVRAAVVYSPLEIHGNYGIVKVPISTLNSPVNGTHFSIFTGNISLAFSSEFIGGRRKSRR